MKLTTLRKLKDGKLFKFTDRHAAPWYEIQQKKKGKAMVTSISSNRTFEKSLSVKCFID